MPAEAGLATPPPGGAVQGLEWHASAALRVRCAYGEVPWPEGPRGEASRGADFFSETARLKGVGQTSISGGGGSPPTYDDAREERRDGVQAESRPRLADVDACRRVRSDKRVEDDEARFEQKRCARPAEGRVVCRSNSSRPNKVA